MHTAIHSEPSDVKTTLEALEVSIEVLKEAVQSGYLSRSLRTENDAPNAAGFYQWNDTLRSLRENMARHGWYRNNDGNWPTTVHPQKRLAIAVSTGNHNTGKHDANPSTKTAKGALTAKAVSNNEQLWLPDMAPFLEEDTKKENYPTWLLLFCTNENELRAELSLPVTMDCKGHVSSWHERIILPSIPLDPVITMPEEDFGPDVDIRITRKA